MVEIRETLPGDIWLIEADLRQEEIDELAALGVTCFECMRLGMMHSTAYTAFINDEPAGMFGVLSDGTIWGVFTNAIDRHPLAFLRASRRVIQDLGSVSNYVDMRNEKAVKWFRWLGFVVDDPVPYGNSGELFHEFKKVA